jgi:CheY-like chemotaxis protein
VVAEASNGRQAVERYRKHLPDVTLLDLRMPLMSGVEVALVIRKEAVPVIFGRGIVQDRRGIRHCVEFRRIPDKAVQRRLFEGNRA